ncbi:MAG: hypothetical protein WB404_08345, partial [Methanoregula sp.]
MEWSPYLKTWIIQFSDINNGRTTEFHSNRFTTTNLQLFMAVEASQQGVIINPTPTVPSLNNGLTGSISFNNIIIQNNGQSVPVIFSPDICSLATQHFNSLNVVINPTPLSVSLITQPISYTITATANFNGAISPSGSVIVVDGASQTFTITANQWYVIDDVEVDGTSVGGSDLQTFSYTIPDVTEDHMIHASFKRAQIYTITPNAGSGGSITPSTTVRVRQGQSQTFTITPDTGYAIEDVQIDAGTPNAIDAGATSSYTFPNVQADQTISATFNLIQPNNPMTWDWSSQGWGNWQYTWTVSGTQTGPNSPLGPEIDNGVGVFGTNTNLLAGSTESDVTNTFTDPTGTGWNTLIFNGALGASDVPGGRWMTITVNGQEVFGATELQTPPGDADQPFTIVASFPQTSSAMVTLSQGQDPAWGPDFPMYCNSLTIGEENTQQ